MDSTKYEIRWITADSIVAWASEREGVEFTLQSWIKRLVIETSKNFMVSIPTGKGAYGGGWDGVVINGDATRFAPSGTSLWEIGVWKKPVLKLNLDYEKRTDNPLGYEFADSTFVLVTPFRVDNKLKWIKDNSTSDWKEVRVYDAEDLADWFAIAPNSGFEFAKIIGRFPEKDFFSIDGWWYERKKNTSIEAAQKLNERIRSLQPQSKKLLEIIGIIPRLIKVKDKSVYEAMRFICLSIENSTEEIQSTFFSKAVLINSETAFRSIYKNTQSMILLPQFNVEDNGLLQCAVEDNDHIVIMPIEQELNFEDTTIIDLTQPPMQKSNVELTEEANFQIGMNIQNLEKGDLKQVIKLKSTPNSNPDVLVPAMIVGKWNERNENDRLIIEAMSGKSYEDFIRMLKIRVEEDNLQIRKIGDDWLIENPLNLWEQNANKIRIEDMRNINICFRAVVGERNPALDLPPSERYAASIYGKNYKFTSRIKEGICQSLVFIALFGEKYGVPVSGTHQGWVNNVISNLLREPEFDIWASLGRTTMLLAEAAPAIFLDCIESIIFSIGEKEKLNDLFIEEPGFLSVTSHRTEILWSLEKIAWIPQYTLQVCKILIQLPDYDSKGNLSNKSINSLANILCSWCPQTYASLDERILILRTLCKQFPEKSWSLLFPLIPKHYSILMPNVKMKWRENLRDELQVKESEISKFIEVIIEVIIQNKDIPIKEMSDLIGISDSNTISPKQRQRLLKHLQSIVSAESDSDNILWHKLRDFLNRHRMFPDALWALRKGELPQYQLIFDKLSNPASGSQLLWLFDDYHPELSSNKFLTSTYENQEILIKKERIKAIKLMLPKRDVNKLIEIANGVKLPHVIAELLTKESKWNNYESVIELLTALLQVPLTDNILSTLAAFLGTLHKNQIFTILELKEILQQVLNNGIKNTQIAHLLAVANFRSFEIWDYIHLLGEEAENVYWKICPMYFNESSSESIEFIIKKLKIYYRNASILQFAYNHRKVISTERIIEILSVVGYIDSSEPHNLGMMEHYVGELFEELYLRSDGNKNEIQQLEVVFLPLFANYDYIKHSKYIQSSLLNNPEVFVDVLKAVYKSEIEEESENNELETQANKAAQADVGYKLLKGVRGIPGGETTGEIQYDVLYNWVNEVRKMSLKYHRLGVCDTYIGELLAKYTGFNKAPKIEVCKIIDSINSSALNKGFTIGIINKRGVVIRGKGGNQEREIVNHYTQFASEIGGSYPVVSSLLLEIAQRYQVEAEWNDNREELEDLEGYI